jgi:hypothetical protein
MNKFIFIPKEPMTNFTPGDAYSAVVSTTKDKTLVMTFVADDGGDTAVKINARKFFTEYVPVTTEDEVEVAILQQLEELLAADKKIGLPF